MTPAAKAQDLMEKFVDGLFVNGNPNHIKAHAKQCSLIAVDEVIEEIEDLQNNCLMQFPLALEYWSEVKKCIEVL